MDQLATNQKWLYDNMPSVLYTYNQIRRKEGVRMVAGRTLIGAVKNSHQDVDVRFGNYFSAGCNPIITTGVIANAQRRFFVTIDGYGQLMPDNRGFQIHVYLDGDTHKKTIVRNIYVTWQAVGY